MHGVCTIGKDSELVKTVANDTAVRIVCRSNPLMGLHSGLHMRCQQGSCKNVIQATSLRKSGSDEQQHCVRQEHAK